MAPCNLYKAYEYIKNKMTTICDKSYTVENYQKKIYAELCMYKDDLKQHNNTKTEYKTQIELAQGLCSLQGSTKHIITMLIWLS